MNSFQRVIRIDREDDMKKGAPNKNEEPAKMEFSGRTDDQLLHERITERAYQLHQERGGSHGRDLEDWLEAERMILSEQNGRSDTPTHLKFRPNPSENADQKRSKERKAASG
jgi:hypothetical protein